MGDKERIEEIETELAFIEAHLESIKQSRNNLAFLEREDMIRKKKLIMELAGLTAGNA